MMKKFSTFLLFAVTIAVLSWFLPWLYAICTPTSPAEPFMGFSPVSGRWISTVSRSGEKPEIISLPPFSRYGIPGDTLTADDRDSLLPQIYYRQLSAHGRMSDSIFGKETSMHTLRTHEANFRSSPRDIVKRTPGIHLMMESMPVRVDLTDPDEAFRMTADGMEFIRIADNTVNAARSRRFTQALKAKGFRFPGTDFSANITSRKAYDEGYLMVDSEGSLFHVKQQGGRPYVAAVTLPAGVRAAKAFIWEENNRDLLGMAVDTGGRPYLIMTAGHRAVPLPAGTGTVDPAHETILVMGNLFNIIMRVSSPGSGTRWMAYDADTLSLLGTIKVPRPYSAAGALAKYLFPYTLSFISADDSLAYPRLGNFSAKALMLNSLLAATLLLSGIRRKDSLQKRGALVTVLFGLYSFLPFIILRSDN